MQDTRLIRRKKRRRKNIQSCKLKQPRSVRLSINLFVQQPIFIGRATFFNVRRMDAKFLSLLRFHDVFCLQTSYQHYLRKPLYQCLAFYSFFQNNNAQFGITVSNKLFSGIMLLKTFIYFYIFSRLLDLQPPFLVTFSEFSYMTKIQTDLQ